MILRDGAAAVGVQQGHEVVDLLLELAALAYRTGRLTYACRQAAGGVLLAALTAAGIYLTLRCRSIRRKGEEKNPPQ